MVNVLWASGKKASVSEVNGERISLRSEASFAPGAPATGTLEEHPSQEIIVKVHGCRRDGDAFIVTGRLINVTRALRALLSPPPPALASRLANPCPGRPPPALSAAADRPARCTL